jgi:hypothetical protein
MTAASPKDSSAPKVEVEWRSGPVDPVAWRRLLIALFEPERFEPEREGGGADAT